MTTEQLEAAATSLEIWVIIWGAVVAIGLLMETIVGFRHFFAANKYQAALKRDNLNLNQNVENLKSQNLALEKAVSPRILEQKFTAHQLKPFSGVSVIVAYPPDFEPKRTAGQIRWMLNSAGWKLLPVPKTFYEFYDGVVVYTPYSQNKAGEALVKVLNDNNVVARLGYPISPDKGTILIQVGPKPLPESLQLKPSDMPGDEHSGQIFGNFLIEPEDMPSPDKEVKQQNVK